MAESEDLESPDGTSDAGSSPVSSYTGPPPFNWPMRFGVGGMRAHSTLGGLTRRRSSAPGQSPCPTACKAVRFALKPYTLNPKPYTHGFRGDGRHVATCRAAELRAPSKHVLVGGTVQGLGCRAPDGVDDAGWCRAS